MPQIPRLTSPQVQLNPLQGGEQHVQADPRAFGMGVAEQVGQIGGQVAQAIEQADLVRAKDAVNKFMPVVNELKTNYLSQKGENVWKQGPDGTMSMTDAGLKAFDSSHKDIEDTLGNARQKAIFKDMSTRLRIEYQGQLGAHEATEGKNWQLGVDQSHEAAGYDDVAANVANKTVSPATMLKSLGIINEGLEGQAAVLGWDRGPGGTLDQKRKIAFSKAHSIVLNGMIQDGNYSGAKDWANKATADGELTPDAINHFGPLIKKGADFKETNDLVTKVLLEGGTEEDQAQKINAAYPEDKEKRDAARQEWGYRTSVLESSKKTESAKTQGLVLRMLYQLRPGDKQMGLNDVMNTAEWNSPAIDDKWRDAVKQEWYDRHKPKGDKEANGAQEIARYSLLMQMKSDPGKLAEANENELAAMYTTLGLSHTKDLIDAAAKAKAHIGTAREVKFPMSMIKSVMKEWGELKSTTKMTKQDEANIGLLLESLEPAVASLQMAKAKQGGEFKLDDQEWRDAIDGQMKTLKLKATSLFGGDRGEKLYKVRDLGALAMTPENADFIAQRSRETFARGVDQLRTERRSQPAQPSAPINYNPTDAELNQAISILDKKQAPITDWNVQAIVLALRSKGK
ncbi:MAG: hypothetical protein WC455_26665 [Dehalococcoidia bacterium]|jgi:hypothetical protein